MFKTFVADSLLTIPLTFLAIVFFTFVFALNPSFASAQADPPEDQPLDSTIYCPHITQTLIRGDCDEGLNRDWCLRHVQNQQVTELQHFLSDYYDIEPEDIMTGYFGNLTKRTVQRFQREQGLPSFGIVGRFTRDAIARVCGTQPPPNTTPAPTCSLNAIPSSIILGQPAFLVWTSTNASTATITNVGSVLTIGAQQVSPTQTTVYSGTFTGLGGSTTCTITITVTPPTGNASCTTPWGATIPHASSTIAYQFPSVPVGQQCVSEGRTCDNGTLLGSYQYATCQALTTSLPTITGTNTDDPTPGTTVIITGTNFTTQNNILLDNVVQQTNVGSTDSGTKLNFVVPANYPTGTTPHALQVSNANGTSSPRYIRVRALGWNDSGNSGAPIDCTIATTTPCVSLGVNGYTRYVHNGQGQYTVSWNSKNVYLCSLTWTNWVPTDGNQSYWITPNVPGSGPSSAVPRDYTLTCQSVAGAKSVTVSIVAPKTPPPVGLPIVSLTVNGQQSITLPLHTAYTVAWSSSNATSCRLTDLLLGTHPTPPNTVGSYQRITGLPPGTGDTFTYSLTCTNSNGSTTKTATVTSRIWGGGEHDDN